MDGLFRFYDTFFYDLGRSVYTFPTDAIKLALLGSTYTPNPSYGVWGGLLTFAAGDVIYSSAYQCFFVASVGGMTGLGAPIFNADVGSTTVDGSVEWTSVGLAPPSAHAVLADVVADEITGTGYTAGGTAITCTHEITGRRAALGVSEAVWPNSTITAKYAVLYKSGTVGLVVNPLIGYMLLDGSGGVVADNAGDFRVRFADARVYALAGF